jgi:hypothetical protein
VFTRWCSEDDTLQLSSWRQWGISRLPRVNAGKKNVHLSSPGTLHDALATLADEAGFARLLSAYSGSSMSLTEVGLSLTRGRGAGMEWHADGGEGEATVLMALDDQPAERGALGIVPGSHRFYAGGGDEDGVEAAMEACERRVCWNAYAAGCPVLIDARTLHAAAANESDGSRVVAWFIFNTG